MKKFAVMMIMTLCMALCSMGFAACGEEKIEDSGAIGGGSTQEQQQPAQRPHTHSFGEWQVTREASCLKAGEKQRTCKCGQRQTEEIPAIGHSFEDEEGIVVKSPTCCAVGRRMFLCIICKSSVMEMIPVNPDAHEWGREETETPATCSEEGVSRVMCLLCKEYKTTPIPKNPNAHKWGEEEMKTPATCAKEGENTITCLLCNMVKTMKTPKDPDAHAWGEEEIKTPSTCFSEGEKIVKCKLCEKTISTPIPIDPDAHELGEWVDEVPADCVSEGVRGHYKCKICKRALDKEKRELQNLTIPALGHDIHTAEIGGSCEMGVFRVETCLRCDADGVCKQIVMPKPHTGAKECKTCGLNIYKAYADFITEKGAYISENEYAIKKSNYASGSTFDCTWSYSDNKAVWKMDVIESSKKKYTITLTSGYITVPKGTTFWIPGEELSWEWKLELFVSSKQSMNGELKAKNFSDYTNTLPYESYSGVAPNSLTSVSKLASSLTSLLLNYTRVILATSPEGFNIDGFGFARYSPVMFHTYTVNRWTHSADKKDGEINFYCTHCEAEKSFSYTLSEKGTAGTQAGFMPAKIASASIDALPPRECVQILRRRRLQSE